jgi:5-methylcytosine-specific restriction protein A
VPYAPLKPCTHPTCGALVKKGACDLHKKEKRKGLEEDEYRKRAKVFYRSKAWQDCRREVLAREPVCTECGKALSSIGAHVRPLRWCMENERMDMAADPSNVQGKCKPCHDSESGSQARARQLGKDQEELKCQANPRAETFKWKL